MEATFQQKLTTPTGSSKKRSALPTSSTITKCSMFWESVRGQVSRALSSVLELSICRKNRIGAIGKLVVLDPGTQRVLDGQSQGQETRGIIIERKLIRKFSELARVLDMMFIIMQLLLMI